MADPRPTPYGTSHARMMQSRWSGPLGDAVRSMAPVVFPGAPSEALVGFTAEAEGPADDTCSVRGQSFHELGYYQVPGGPCSGPAPNADPLAPSNAWGRLAGTPLVQSLLGGRDATTTPNAWKTAIEDQAAVGLANLQRDGASVASMIPDALVPRDPGSLWAVALAFTGFSAGPARAAALVNRYAATLALADEDVRWWALVRAVATDAAAGVDLGPVHSHANLAYRALRTTQKLAAGEALAKATGGDAAWFAWPMSGAWREYTEEALTHGAMEGPPRLAPTSGTVAVLSFLALVGLGVAEATGKIP